MQQRYVLTFMIFCAILVGIAERTVLSMAITQMVHRPHQNNTEKPPAESYCSPPVWAVNQTRTAITVNSMVGIDISYPSFLIDNFIHRRYSYCSPLEGRRRSEIQLDAEGAGHDSVIVLRRIHRDTHSGWIAGATLRWKVCPGTGYLDLGSAVNDHPAGRSRWYHL